jgi:hypothetical protein
VSSQQRLVVSRESNVFKVEAEGPHHEFTIKRDLFRNMLSFIWDRISMLHDA